MECCRSVSTDTSVRRVDCDQVVSRNQLQNCEREIARNKCRTLACCPLEVPLARRGRPREDDVWVKDGATAQPKLVHRHAVRRRPSHGAYQRAERHRADQGLARAIAQGRRRSACNLPIPAWARQTGAAANPHHRARIVWCSHLRRRPLPHPHNPATAPAPHRTLTRR